MSSKAIARRIPEQRVVTVMFVDMVGFSMVAEKNPPDVVFRILQEHIDQVSKTVQSFGGVIDRVLGDGVLAFFGYKYDGSKSVDNHADVAIMCAEQIQRESIEKIAKTDPGEIILPLRIGINTSTVIVGDLGYAQRVDLTLVGSGVNYASRLETSCEPFRIMIGAATLEQCSAFSTSTKGLQARHIAVKHHTELFSAYEYSTKFSDPDAFNKAARVYAQYHKYSRKNPRYQINPEGLIGVESSEGAGVMVNFSMDGCGIILDKYLACGVFFSLQVNDQQGNLLSIHKEIDFFMPLVAEVRWAGNFRDRYLHGVRIRNLNPDQMKFVFNLIKSSVLDQGGTMEEVVSPK